MAINSELTVGDRVVHPKKSEWGVGQVVSMNGSNLMIHFDDGGERTLQAALAGLRKVEGPDAESTRLDTKFRAKRKRIRREIDNSLFNGGRQTSRKKFIESLGATCTNWFWSWSFVNDDEKKIIFGAWQDFKTGNRALIFSNSWETKNGKKRSSWPESRENIRKIEEGGYTLHVFTMILDPDSEPDYEKGPRKIGVFRNDLAQARLEREGGDWYAVFPEDKET